MPNPRTAVLAGISRILIFYPRDDHKTTNIVLADAGKAYRNLSIFRDTKPGVDPQSLYKAIGGCLTTSEHSRFSRRTEFTSESSVQSQSSPKSRSTSRSMFDCAKRSILAPRRSRNILLYYRYYVDKKNAGARLESDDFVHWSNSQVMEYQRYGQPAPIEQLYTNQTSPYFRAPQIYISTAARFIRGRGRLSPRNRLKRFTSIPNTLATHPTRFSHPVTAGIFSSRTFMSALVAPGWRQLGLARLTIRRLGVITRQARGNVSLCESELRAANLERPSLQPAARWIQLAAR